MYQLLQGYNYPKQYLGPKPTTTKPMVDTLSCFKAIIPYQQGFAIQYFNSDGPKVYVISINSKLMSNTIANRSFLLKGETQG